MIRKKKQQPKLFKSFFLLRSAISSMWIVARFFHSYECFWQEQLPEEHFVGSPIWYSDRVYLRLLKGHTFQALGSLPPLDQPLQATCCWTRWSEDRVGGRAWTTPALSYKVSLKGEGRVHEHRLLLLLPSVCCGPLMVSHRPGATWSHARLGTLSSTNEGLLQ